MSDEGYTQYQMVERIRGELDQASIGVLVHIMELLHPGYTMEGIKEPVTRYRLVKKRGAGQGDADIEKLAKRKW